MKTQDDREFLSGMMDGEWQGLDVRRSIADVCADEALRAKWSRYHLARQAMQREAVVPGGSLAERIAAAVADEPTYSNVTAIGASAGGAAVGTGDAPAEGSASAVASVQASPDDDDVGGAAPGEAAVVPIPRRASAARTFAAGFGLAASVAVVTALGLNLLDGGGAPGGDGATVARVASSDAAAPADASLDPFSRQLPGAPLPNVELVSNVAPSGAYWTDADSSERRTASEARLNMLLSQHIENSPTAERQGMLPYSRLVGYDERAGERPAERPAGR